MSKYNRIKLEITDLSPESASKVFEFIDNCLEKNDLNIIYFKNNIDKYTIAEKYFIFHYSKRYFSSSHGSYLNKWLRDKENQLGEGDHKEQLLNYFTKISKGATEVLNYININENTIERQFKASKKKNICINVKSNPIDYRIPLYFKFKSQEKLRVLEELSEMEINKDVFKQQTKNILSELMQGKEFEDFFYNSFDYQGNIYSVNELNIEFENSSILYSKFYDLYKFYCENKNTQNRIINDYYQKLLVKEKEEKMKNIKNLKILDKKIENFRIKYVLSKKAPVIENVGRFEFMKIMYNTFPQIRESYFLYLHKNPSADLNSYLKTKSRNIK